MRDKKTDTSMVRIDTKVKNKVAKLVAGTGITIGEYFEWAAIARLKEPTAKPSPKK